MLDDNFLLINEAFDVKSVSPFEMDLLLEDGWRNFGTYFFRHNIGIYRGELRRVIPLRIFVPGFRFSRSHRKNLSRNSDLRIENRPIIIDDEKLDLFDRHKQRFAEHIPESIHTFLSTSPANVPSEAFEICVYEGDKLLAVSFYNLGEESVSGIYAMFEPAELKRGLGILTMLLEIRFTQESNRKFYYQGYAYEGPSFYDYKKRFTSLEMYDWEGRWLAFSE